MSRSRCLYLHWPRPQDNLRSPARHLAALGLLLALTLSACNDVPEPSANYHEYAYVTNGLSNTVSVVDLRALSVLATVTVGKSPTGIAENPKRNEIYVANTESNSVSVIDAESNKVVSTIGVHRAPYFVSVSADGTRAYVANSGSANVSVIDLAGRKALKPIPVGHGSDLARGTPAATLVVVALRLEDFLGHVEASSLSPRLQLKACPKPGD